MATRTFATGTTTSWNTGNTFSSSSNNSIGVWRHGTYWWLADGQHPEQCREASDRERFRWLSDRCRISTVSAGCQRAPADGQITWSPVGNVRIVCNDVNDVAVEFKVLDTLTLSRPIIQCYNFKAMRIMCWWCGTNTNFYMCPLDGHRDDICPDQWVAHNCLYEPVVLHVC